MSDLLRPNLSPISYMKRNVTAIYISVTQSSVNSRGSFPWQNVKIWGRQSVSRTLTRLLDSSAFCLISLNMYERFLNAWVV